jgi:hypothetical protein
MKLDITTQSENRAISDSFFINKAGTRISLAQGVYR